MREAGPWLEWLAAIDGVLDDDGDRRRRQRDVLLPRRARRAAVPAAALVPAPGRLRHARLRGAGRDRRVARLPGSPRARAERRRRPDVHAARAGLGRRARASRCPWSCSSTRATARSATGWSRPGFAPVGVDLPTPDLPAAARALGCAGDARRPARRARERARGRVRAPRADRDHGARGTAGVTKPPYMTVTWTRPRVRAAGLPRDRPPDRRRQRRRAADARGLHPRGGRRPRARDEPEGGGRVRRPATATRRSAAPRAASTATRTTPMRSACCAATSRRCGPSSSATGRPARTSACARSTIDEAAAEAGLRSSIDAALLRLDDPEAGLAAPRAAFAVDVDGIGLGEVVGGYGVAQAALTALERLALDPLATRAVVQGFGSMGGATARYLARAGRPRGRDRRPPRADREPGRARRRAPARGPRRPRRDRPRRARARATSSGRAPTGWRSTPSCSCRPRCPT